MRLALDQNFPTPVVSAMQDFMPPAFQFEHIPKIDTRMSRLSDRELIICLHQKGYDGLISGNYRMLYEPDEVAAMVKTKMTMILMKQMGDNMLRASGALFLELPGLDKRIRPGKSNVFLLSYDRRTPQGAWDYLSDIAAHRSQTPQQLWDTFQPTDSEMKTLVLPPRRVKPRQPAPRPGE